jgi:hypothetical protein
VDHVVVRQTDPPSTAADTVAAPDEKTRPESVTKAPPVAGPLTPREKLMTGES